MMELKVLENSQTTALFEVTGVTPSFLNALRRMMLSHVPKLAIDDVTIYDNTSALFDEMVSHRLGLLPVPTDLGLFVRRSECTCNNEGCANCTVLFTLSKEGPCTVYSGDLVPAADAKFRIVDPKIPVVKLLEGQRVMMEAGAVLGTGIEHAKWQVVTACGYTEYPIAKINGALPSEVVARMQSLAPEGAVRIEGETVTVLDQVKAYDILRAMSDLYEVPQIELSFDPERYLVTVETDGALSPVVAMRKAVSLLMEKLKTVEAELPKLKPIETPAA